MIRESGNPSEERLDFSTVNHIPERVAQFLSTILKIHELHSQWGRDRFSDELPEDRSQLRLAVKRESVIDPPHFSGHVPQTMTDLPVGIVDDVVEQNHLFDGRVPAAPEVMVVLTLAFRLNIELEAADAMRTVSDHRWWNEIPSRPATEQVGG